MGVFAPYTAKLSVTCSIYKAAKRAPRRPFVISRVSLAENRLCTYVVAALQVSVLTRIAKRAHHFLECRVGFVNAARLIVAIYLTLNGLFRRLVQRGHHVFREGAQLHTVLFHQGFQGLGVAVGKLADHR